MKAIVNAIVVVVLLGLAGLWLYAEADAGRAQIAELVAKAEQNEEAKLLVAMFLSENPEPTVGEVANTSSEVEKLLVRETARNAVSDAGLKPVAEPSELIVTEADPVPFPVIKVVSVFAVLMIFLLLLRVYSRAKAGW